MQDTSVIPALSAADNDTRVQASTEAHPVDIDFPAPKHHGPKTHKRAGITKNHNHGQSKERRRMAAQSRRRNR
jgi:hypothetical protein